MDDVGRFAIGNQTAFSVPVLEPFLFAVEHGFDAFELFPDGGPQNQGWSTRDLSPETRSFISTTSRERGIRLSVHAAMESDPLSGAGLSGLARDLELGREVGAKIVNLHLQPGDWEAYCRAVLALVDSLAPAGMALSLENTIPVSPDDINRVFARLQELDVARSRSIGLCLDIGHANLHPATCNDFLAFVDGLSPQVPIIHAHLHENWGDRDQHLTLFTGPARRSPAGIVGLLRRLRQRRYAGSLILEQWPDPPSLLVAARDRLRELQSSAESRPGGPA